METIVSPTSIEKSGGGVELVSKRGYMTTRQPARRVGRPPAGLRGQRVRDYPQLSIRVPRRLRAQITTFARSQRLSQLELLLRAIECYMREVRSKSREPNGRSRRKA